MQATRFTFVGICLLWIGFAFLALLTYTKDNPIRFSYEFQQNIRTLFPQGWAFFTKSPRDENLQLYRFVNNRLELVDGQRQATFANLMGFRRAARAMSVEYAYLLYDVPADKWKRSEIAPEAYIRSHNLPEVTVINKTPSPLLDGTYYLVQQGLVPWAWSSQADKITLPSSILKLSVVCKR
ncbi:SdpA family antimicrobial peptide system protein [Spirosoma sp. KNUC1025]|uniref:SdpA family antimicrobial peptide system protein n=1 Tax=Spirosoma sp. KNUC1025 TaxID=2894082 RepID=UPI0038707A93|nr:SdpA family antimicrobial peptide system protein [Spirosoma sp. KNUC1025]